jgi:hypothetical protein
LKKIQVRNSWLFIVLLALLIATLLAYGAKAMVPYIHFSLVREAQTASFTRDFVEHGINILVTHLDFMLPKPNNLLFEFPVYEAIVASLMIAFGFDLVWGKIVSVLSFGGSIGYVFALCIQITGRPRVGLLAVAVFVIFALNRYIQATFMIEPLALLVALGCIYHGLRWFDNRSHLQFALFFALGLLASVVKPFHLMPLAFPFLLEIAYLQGNARKRSSAAVFSAMVVWGLALVAWYLWSNHVNQEGVFLSEGNGRMLRDQFVGPLAARFDPQLWSVLGTSWRMFVLPSPWWAWNGLYVAGLVIAVAVGPDRARRFCVGALAGGLMYLFCFFQVLATHFYYMLAYVPLLAITIAIAVDWMLVWTVDRLDVRSLGRAFGHLVAIAAAVLLIWWSIKTLQPILGAEIGQLLDGWSYRRFDLYVALICAALVVFSVAAALCFGRRAFTGDVLAIFGAVALFVATMQGYTGLLIYSDRFWLLTQPIVAVVTAPMIEQTEWVRARLPANGHAVIVSSRRSFYHEFMLMSGARGQMVGFHKRDGRECLNGRRATGMEPQCIEFLHSVGLDDYFVVFTSALTDPSPAEFEQQTRSFGVSCIDKLEQGSGQEKTTTVLHYRYQPQATAPNREAKC